MRHISFWPPTATTNNSSAECSAAHGTRNKHTKITKQRAKSFSAHCWQHQRKQKGSPQVFRHSRRPLASCLNEESRILLLFPSLRLGKETRDSPRRLCCPTVVLRSPLWSEGDEEKGLSRQRRRETCSKPSVPGDLRERKPRPRTRPERCLLNGVTTIEIDTETCRSGYANATVARPQIRTP
jgi:hypothetical protein